MRASVVVTKRQNGFVHRLDNVSQVTLQGTQAAEQIAEQPFEHPVHMFPNPLHRMAAILLVELL